MRESIELKFTNHDTTSKKVQYNRKLPLIYKDITK